MKERKLSFPPQYDKGVGLDIHKDKINGCLIHLSKELVIHKEFPTDTASLESLRSWLETEGVSEVIMESTGIYWRSLYEILSVAKIKVILVNPQHVRQIPGRKTDEMDSEWLCRLLLHGLVRGSFIPPSDQQELRDYSRRRFRYKQLQSQTKNQLLRVLEICNCKLRSVVSNVNTKSAMSIIRAISEGQTKPEELVKLCLGRLRPKAQQMIPYLKGHFKAHDIEQLKMILADFDHFEAQIKELDKHIEAILEQKYSDVEERLIQVSGIGKGIAQTILAEAGKNMQVFPTADHFTAWAGLAPGNHQSASKNRPTKIRKGNKYLMVAMIQAAWAAVRTKDSFWSAQYYHLKRRMPAKKAIVAIARKMLKLVYRIIKGEIQYQERGATAFFEQLQNRKKAPKNTPG